MASMRTYVVMVRDELGDIIRAYGSPALEAEYQFPEFNAGDDAMCSAFWIWLDTIEATLNREWQSIYGEECEVFLERKHDRTWFYAQYRDCLN